MEGELKAYKECNLLCHIFNSYHFSVILYDTKKEWESSL